MEQNLSSIQVEKTARTLQHSTTVAQAARLLASFSPEIDENEAFQAGLFHDFGKFFLSPEEIYLHPLLGYELMLQKGWPRIAAVCLTHPFPSLENKEYLAHYCRADMTLQERFESAFQSLPSDPGLQLLCSLIQLCDKLAALDQFVSLESKFQWYAGKHDEQPCIVRHRQDLLDLKKRFDSLLGKDVYAILGIA